MTENLRDDDFSVLSAATVAAAIDLLGHTRPDVALLDVVPPDMSGYDVCRLVRPGDGVNDPWDPDLPIIMLSSDACRAGAAYGRVEPSTRPGREISCGGPRQGPRLASASSNGSRRPGFVS